MGTRSIVLGVANDSVGGLMGSRRGLAALMLASGIPMPYTTGLEQDDPAKPIASAFGHFMLRQTPGVDGE